MILLDHPAVLWLLPLALWPWLPVRGPAQVPYASLSLLAFDRRSAWIGRALRACASLAIAALLAALAGPHRPESAVQTVRQGAEVVVLLDRSLSMDQPFGRPANAALSLHGTSKAQVAQQLIGEFMKQRSDDLFGLILFSTLPLPVLTFTQRQEAIQAAISSTGTSRALGDTDVGQALLAASGYFDGREYSGSRAVVLVSDGGAQLDPATRDRITEQFARNRISLYFLYIRSRFSPGLTADDGAETAGDDQVPERALHKFFSSLKTPYRAYQAEDAEALQRAIEDVGRLERAPLQLAVLQPGVDLRRVPLAVALAAIAVLVAAAAWTVRPWQAVQ